MSAGPALGGSLAGCQAGDPASIRQFFTAHAPRVYRWALFRGLSPADAEDTAQEVLVIASRRFETCSSEAAVTSWLFQITRRVVANGRRKRWVRDVFSSSGAMEAGLEHPHDGGASLQFEIDMRRCLAKLPAAQAEVLILFEVDEFTRDEVAAMLGVPAGTVASRLRVARAAFRAVWEAEGLT